MTSDRINTALIRILLGSMLIVVFGCGEEVTPGPVDMTGDKPTTGPTAGIRGLLVNQATKQTLGNARVQLVDSQGESRESLTTQAGVFEFENLPADEKFTVVVELDDYEKHEAVVNPIRTGETEKITVNLVPILRMDELSPGDGLNVGAKAPTFNLADGNGKRHSLIDYTGKQRVVLLFDRGAW